jgi:NADH-quinone oxidoreductase subunit N
VKYLILGALSTGFVVYGIVWLYGITGQLTFEGVAAALPVRERGNDVALLFTFALLITGLGFKIAAVPFQIWVPDVYQGAPTPVTAFLSVASKAAGFAVLMRVLEVLYHAPVLGGKMGAVLGVITGATLLYGNLAAIPQSNVKRLLAYSSIAHAGYLLLAIVSHSGPAVAFYLATYLPMTFVAFLVVIVVSNAVGGDNIKDFVGLKTRSPLLAAAMLIAMLSLAGIPFTSGFVGKALVFFEALKMGHFVLAAIGVVTVAAGFYYYLKVIRAMYWTDAQESAGRIPVGMLSAVVLVSLCIAIVALGVYPAPLVEWSGFPSSSEDFLTDR